MNIAVQALSIQSDACGVEMSCIQRKKKNEVVRYETGDSQRALHLHVICISFSSFGCID
jgi:hypothetical protein